MDPRLYVLLAAGCALDPYTLAIAPCLLVLAAFLSGSSIRGIVVSAFIGALQYAATAFQLFYAHASPLQPLEASLAVNLVCAGALGWLPGEKMASDDAISYAAMYMVVAGGLFSAIGGSILLAVPGAMLFGHCDIRSLRRFILVGAITAVLSYTAAVLPGINAATLSVTGDVATQLTIIGAIVALGYSIKDLRSVGDK